MGFDVEGGTSLYSEIERLRKSHDYWQTAAINWERKAADLERVVLRLREALEKIKDGSSVIPDREIARNALEQGTP